MRLIAARLVLGLLVAAPLPAVAQNSSWHVNVFAGVGVLDQTRTVGGVKLVDLGGDFLLGGLRAGWGYSFVGGLYLGAEFEGFAASGRARAVVSNEAYSYSVRGGLGTYARAGWQSQGGALFFGRAGLLMMNTNEGWRGLPALGVGAEVPIANLPGDNAAARPANVSLRVDLTYAWDRVEHYMGTVGAVVRW
jgi:hypothetical protein